MGLAKVPISQEGETEVERDWILQGLCSWEILILIIAESQREIRSGDPPLKDKISPWGDLKLSPWIGGDCSQGAGPRLGFLQEAWREGGVNETRLPSPQSPPAPTLMALSRGESRKEEACSRRPGLSPEHQPGHSEMLKLKESWETIWPLILSTVNVKPQEG